MRTTLAGLAVLFLVAIPQPNLELGVRPAVPPARDESLDAFRKAALGFEPNLGQAPPGAEYVARGDGFSLQIGRGSFAVVSDRKRGLLPSPPPPAVQVRFEGGATSRPAIAEGRQRGRSNYLRGSDPSRWLTGVPRFDRVRCEEIYPGIDVVYHGRRGSFEYDFEVAPGADPGVIRIAFDADATLDEEGALLLASRGAELRQEPPVAYQEDGSGARTPVAAWYELDPGGRARIGLGTYDASRTLVVDPALGFSTYFGGQDDDIALGIAVDEFGSAYVAGETLSGNFHILNPVQGDIGTFVPDAFVSKLAPGGEELEYSTFLGGDFVDRATAIAVDATGAAYVTGFTGSSDFPTVNAFQGTNAGGFGNEPFDAFVTKLSPSGDALVYSTYFGGSDWEFATGIGVDAAGNAAIGGETKSADMPTFVPFQPNIGSVDRGSDGFVAKLSAAGNVLLFSTFLGGTSDETVTGVASDAAGAVYVTGWTVSSNFPRVRAFDSTLDNVDAFVAKLDTRANVSPPLVVYSSLLGGSENDFGSGIAVDAAGAPHVTGMTESANFPTRGGFQTSRRGARDAFLTKVSADGASVAASTYLGGSDEEAGAGIAVDADGAVYVTGLTLSEDFPVRNEAQQVHGGGDSFVAKLRPGLGELEHASFLGGTSYDYGTAIAVDDFGAVYLTGLTSSTDFPEIYFFQSGGFAGGDSDAFVTRIVGVYEFAWDPPEASSSDDVPPPRNLTARQTDTGASAAAPRPDSSEKRAEVICYTLYQIPKAGGQRRPVRQLPPSQTRAPSVPGGARFIVTACYSDGRESAPSKEIGAGAGEAVITSLKVSGSKVTVVGAKFSSSVKITVDGLAFTSAAKVKKANTKVVQKGSLENGQTIDRYMSGRAAVFFLFENTNGATAGYVYRP